MKAIMWNKQEHLNEVLPWFRAWWKAEMPEWWFPNTGFYVPGVIVAFLYVDSSSGLAFLESIMSNPDSKHEDRQAGLDAMEAKIEEYCLENNIKAVQGQTANRGVVEAGERLGWKVLPKEYKIFIKMIGDK